MKKSLLFNLILALLLSACGGREVLGAETLRGQPVGEVFAVEDRYGTFYAYLPESLSAGTRVLVVVHGTPQKQDTAEFTAHYYAANWAEFAEEQGLILIVPAFNQPDFSSRYGDHAMTGYRGLFGREIGADEWVLRLVGAFQEAFELDEGRFYIYGHSAGGQYTGRFMVTHPERLLGAVISSAATYPQPKPEVDWPFGMGALAGEIEWDDGTINLVEVAPDLETWLAGTQVPLVVLVGLNDTAELPDFPGQEGNDRYTIAQNWVADMCALAEEWGLDCAFGFEMIPGVGHSMSGMLPYTQEALGRLMGE